MKLTTQDVIKDFKKVHGDKYDYSKVDYKNTDSKVVIICPDHGEFLQSPYYHKNGQRCPKCSGNTKLSAVEVIQQFKEVHGNKYDYSKVDYKNIDLKVMIICEEHGVFLQSPYNHRAGKECPKCSGVGLSREEIIAQFRKVHGSKYDYSKTECTNTRSPIIIICPEHGEFSQNTNSHKQGNGCPKCSGTMKLTQSEIIKDFIQVHGDKYDYSKVNYIGANSKIIIICQEHGEFQQTPSSHKHGSGCPKCLGMGNTTEEIILQFKEVHGDIYEYSKVEFINNKTEVAIICEEHGEFFQIPKTHKLGSGCPKCSGRDFSTEEVIEQFRKVHGDKYDYSKVIFSNVKSPVTIICKEHGEFLQSPDSHKRGTGCAKCSGRDLSTTEISQQFIKVHGDKYDYSKVNYIKSSLKVIIICRDHGEFLQAPDSHKQGHGCPQCSGTLKLTKEEIIKEFNVTHFNKYDYSKMDYINIDSKVTIICPEHGEFLQTPNIHKKGAGCPRCSGNKKLTTEEAIEEFKKMHGDKYDYSKVEYINAKSPIIIRCKEHGEFLQTPDSHKRGSGCPTCNVGWTKPKILEFLHSIENQDLLQMDAVELQMIINQGKLPETFRDLVFADEDNKENTLKALKERLEAELESAEFEELSAKPESQEEDWNQDEVETEDIEVNETRESEESDETDAEIQKKKLLSLSDTNEDLHVLDHDLVSSCDEETIEFLIQYKLRKIWNQVLNKEFSVKEFQAETGGANFTLLQKYFFDEYNEVLKYTPPVGYEFPYAPNLMQKLTVFRLLKHQQYGNWSGTGAGKTLSFILSSRSVDAKLILLIGLNSTIEQLGKNILQAFPDSKVFTHYKLGQKFNRKNRNYLILNYDKFQQEYSEKLFQDLTD